MVAVNRQQLLATRRSWFPGIIFTFICSICSKTGKVNSLEVVPCEGTSCTLHRGKNSTIKLGFQSNVFVKAGSVAVHGVIAHVPVPFSLDNSHICDFLTPSCPIQPNQSYMYTFSLLVRSSYPPVTAASVRRKAAVPPEESTRVEILPGCAFLKSGSRDAEVGFEPRTSQSIRLDIRWELRDDSGSDIACVQFPAQIHD
ncbi:hypothetical protein T265_02301 [Opisthorchis viverrini]|uniref:MD-2-related lipid-recognition domain-containing protein n=1 Tax=Opisthorchis viverrini TaxID=6198 RepID=A0A075AIF3_OPIVI|nr:hypothetical protein T265_02301 [Opisthorchis viverrini]KER31534.1 hypothetical protein T265_02301 [Opisthorchis viverrini]